MARHSKNVLVLIALLLTLLATSALAEPHWDGSLPEFRGIEGERARTVLHRYSWGSDERFEGLYDDNTQSWFGVNVWLDDDACYLRCGTWKDGLFTGYAVRTALGDAFLFRPLR